MNNTVVYDGEMGIITKVTEGDLPYYTGATEVTPSDQTQTLYTAETIVTSNITVNPIPDMELETVEVTYTPTENEQTDTITASAGYDAIEQVNVTVEAIDSEYVGSDIPRNDDSDLTVSGATVTAPAGYYESAASATVASGTEGTPTATKGTVSGHAVSVTPSVTNSAGYISGGTHTGTAVTVSASELVSGNKSITANGTDIDVTDYATVSVAVPGSSPNLETVQVSYTATESAQSDTITPSTGYDGIGEVDVTITAIPDDYVGSAIDRRDSTDLSASGATVTAPAGYYENAASKAVASGSATTPATTITANPSISVNSSTGVITATASASQSVTPTVSAGYVSSGTSGEITVSGSATEQLTTQAAQTIHPSTSDQTISSGKYLSGAQTIKGVTLENLTAENIVSGVTVKVGDSDDDDCVASVTGTASGSGYTDTQILMGDGPTGAITFIPTGNIPTRAISGRQSMTELTINCPSSVTGTNQYVITDNNNLTKLVINGYSGNIASYFITNNSDLTDIRMPDLQGSISNNGIRGNSALTILDCGSPTSFGNTALYGDSSLTTLIIRSTSIPTVTNTSLQNTPFYSNGTGGTIYIPKSLYDHLGDNSALDYKHATNWSTYDGYGHITWAKIEGSIYEI